MDTTSEFFCAYCGESNAVFVDISAGNQQTYTEDCQICCKPNVLFINIDEDSLEITVDAEPEDGGNY